MDIGERIRELRQAEGLSQNALAEKADISQSHLRRVELGQSRITIDLLELICDALNVSIREFFVDNYEEDELTIAISKLTPKQKSKLIEFIKSIK